MLKKIDLTGVWRGMVDPAGPTDLPHEAYSLIGKEFGAKIPGAIHADLQSARIIPDPFIDQNEDLVAWVGRTDWKLERPLPHLTKIERVNLVFDGIDTVATIRLNGRELGRTRNMHRDYRYDISSVLVTRINPTRSPCTSRRPTRRRNTGNEPSATVRTPTPSRSTSSGRWPAALAGAEDRPLSRPVSGETCESKHGAPPGLCQCAHW
ncbi:glycosyl hydrolase 2 galactose-binding domain-containing protein [Subtercola boreus]|uniref:glycosyl hydrolase 2 galactose-binding domain-containing protein n=1 Tax=Subtercola boreus TaxID=120213 RepID=UPI00269F6EFE